MSEDSVTRWWVAPSCGAASGLLADIITHPIATVKTRLQVMGAGQAAASYGSNMAVVTSMLKKEGPLSFFQGLGAVVGAAPFASALYFTGVEATRGALGTSDAANFASGMLGQLAGSLAWVPMDVVKERLQIEGQVAMRKAYGGSLACLRGILATEGLYGLYRAYWIHQMTWAPFNGVFWLVYGRSLSTLEEWSGTKGSTSAFLAASTLGGTVASVLTAPLDLVKTRIQVQMANPDLFNFDGALGCARSVLKTEGAVAFFAGVGARIAWLTPRYILAVSSYEMLKAAAVDRSP